MDPFNLSAVAIAVISIGMAIGGLVKGALGAGLPSVAMPILVFQIEPLQAVILFFVPVIISNIIQIFQGGYYREAISKFWQFLLIFVVGVWFGAQILITASPDIMALVLGLVVFGSTTAQIWASKLSFFPRHGWIIQTLAGGALGLCGGATGVFAPTIVYFAGLRLPKDLFITLLAITAMTGSLALYSRLQLNGWLTGAQLAASAFTLVPVSVGLIIGFWLRERMSESVFRQAIWSGLLILGIGLIIKGSV